MQKTTTIYIKLGKRISLLRKEQGLSQEKLASKAELNRSYMGFIEQGKKRPSLETLAKIANALDIPLPKVMDFDR